MVVGVFIAGGTGSCISTWLLEVLGQWEWAWGGGGDQDTSLWVGSLTPHTPGRKVAELRSRWEIDWPQVAP